MVYLPAEILTDIVRRVGQSGFRELGPIIASGRDGKNVVFTDEVLQEVELDEYLFVASLANEGSPYRCFFMKAFHASNLTAMYIEGVRRLVKYGPADDSLQLIQEAEHHIVYAGFAFGIFAICSGRYEAGRMALHSLSTKLGWLQLMVEVGDVVMAQIADIDPPMAGNYNSTYRYPEGDIPNCVHFACTMDDVCFDCIGYWYARKVTQIC